MRKCRRQLRAERDGRAEEGGKCFGEKDETVVLREGGDQWEKGTMEQRGRREGHLELHGGYVFVGPRK